MTSRHDVVTTRPVPTSGPSSTSPSAFTPMLAAQTPRLNLDTGSRLRSLQLSSNGGEHRLIAVSPGFFPGSHCILPPQTVQQNILSTAPN